jgi:hypothetical protein
MGFLHLSTNRRWWGIRHARGRPAASSAWRSYDFDVHHRHWVPRDILAGDERVLMALDPSRAGSMHFSGEE